MATNIAGLFETPVDPFEEQRRGFQQNLMRSTTPQQFLATVGSNFGGQLGLGAKSLFGFKTPEQEKADDIKEIQKIASQQPDEAEYYRVFIEGLTAKGHTKEAMALAERFKEAKQEKAKAGLQEKLAKNTFGSSADYFQAANDAMRAGNMPTALDLMKTAREMRKVEDAAAAGKAATERRIGTVGRLAPELDKELAAGIAADPDLFKEFSQEVFKAKSQENKVAFQDFDGNVNMIVTDKQGNIVSQVPLGKAPEKAPRVEVSVGGQGQKKYSEEFGRGFAEKDLNLIKNAESAEKQLPKIQKTLDILEKGAPTTGFAAEFINDVNRVRASFIKEKKAAQSVTDTELLSSLLGGDVFPLISALGIGARGLDTPEERRFLQQAFTGTISMNKETIKEMARIRKKYAEAAIEEYNKKVSSGYFKMGEEATGRKLQLIDFPKPTSGVTVTNW